MTFTIRPFVSGDASALAALTLDAIRHIGSRAYSPEQVEAWASGHMDAQRFTQRSKAGHYIYIMADKADMPAAYALLEPDGHLDMLYCSPAHAGRALATRLLEHAEGQARGIGVTRLYTEASELARKPFERAGYVMVERRDFWLRGTRIHNYVMEKALA